jgi:hypothetical protein
MSRRFSAPLTKFLQLDLALDTLAVFSRPVIKPFAGSTLQFDKMVLRHKKKDSSESKITDKYMDFRYAPKDYYMLGQKATIFCGLLR